MSTEFEDRTVVITGGASGIGRELALMTARAGARLVVADLSRKALDELDATAVAEGLSMTMVEVDVSDPSTLPHLISTAESTGGIDAVVCAAGVSIPGSFLDLTLEQWDRTQAINLRGTFVVAQAAARSMVATGTAGSIVTMASGMAVNGPANLADYAASKSGVIGLTKSMARALGGHGIRVNCVAPGPIDTPMFRATMGDTPLSALPPSALGGIGAPVDVASVLAFFISPASRWVTGQTVHVNGGTGMY